MSDTTEDNPINYALEILIEQGFGGGDCDMLKLHLEKYPMLLLRDRYSGEKYNRKLERKEKITTADYPFSDGDLPIFT